MSNRLKPIPKNQAELMREQITPYLTSQGQPDSETPFSANRGTDYSMKNDTVKDISVGLEDIDDAIMYYFNNVIKPNVVQNGQQLAVPVIYGSPERWKSVQADGFYRDNSGRLLVPLIMFKRESFEKDRSVGNKLDGNKAHLYQIVGSKYNIRNAYDRFSVINNRIPSEQYYITAVPDYITLTYNCIIFTDFIEQNNKLVEAVEFASDSYWGDPARWKFRASIDSFTTTTLLEEGTDRAAKSSFTIKVNGYIIPNTVNQDLAVARGKFYTKSQVVFDLEVIDGAGQTTNIDTLRFANKPAASNATAATSFIGGGINVTNITNTTSAAASGDLTYLNTNKQLQANTVTAPNIATFTGASILQPGVTSTLPPTTAANFVVYINGQYVPSSAFAITEGGGNVTITFNTTSLGYSVASSDEIIAIGKFA
jgi:hypothetical protein